tara:strand:+ start:1535 stop:1870 length:336 start_codon:yes stop_codon:yes gene_type:complete
MKEWFKDMESTRKLVIKYLKEYPHTRDSDVELFYLILKDYYRAIPSNKKTSIYEEQFMTDLYVLLKFAPDKSSVSRLRRRIQNDDGMFQSTAEVRKMRDELEDKFRKWALQ